LDIIPGIESQAEKIVDLLVPGKPAKVRGLRVVPGGPVTNTGVSAHRLGLKVELMGLVGTDHLSDLLLTVLQDAAGRSFQGIKKDPSVECPYVIGICPPKIERMYLVDTAAADFFGFEHVDWQIVRNTDIFHLGYPPWLRRSYLKGGEELRRIFARAQELGCTTSLDLSQIMEDTEAAQENWLSLMKTWAPVSDQMMPSVEEALQFIDEAKYKAKRREAGVHRDLVDVLTPEDIFPLAEKLLEFGTRIVMIKCGHKGIYIRTAARKVLEKMGAGAPNDLDAWSDRELWHRVFSVPKSRFVGTMGAGDSAIAGWFASYCRGHNIELCLRHAAAAGSLNATVLDGLSWNKGFEYLNQWQKEPEFPLDPEFRITQKGWKLNNQNGIWYGPHDAKR